MQPASRHAYLLVLACDRPDSYLRTQPASLHVSLLVSPGLLPSSSPSQLTCLHSWVATWLTLWGVTKHRALWEAQKPP
eukprot:10918737-Heterocapsa_arctica.AAC.1